MHEHPFPLFRPFHQRLGVFLLTKEDNIHTDNEIASKTGHDKIGSLWQAHGNRCVRLSGDSRRTEQADGVATDLPGLLLTIRAADCQNFVVYAPAKKVVGVLHVGWRCIEAGTITSFYELLEREWNILPKETYVGAGPSLGKECAEFTDPATELPSVPSSLVSGRQVDLMGAADHQLEELGVPASHRERLTNCTKCESGKYWSYRGGDRGAVVQGYTNVLAAVLL